MNKFTLLLLASIALYPSISYTMNPNSNLESQDSEDFYENPDLRPRLSSCWIPCPLCHIPRKFNSKLIVQEFLENLTDKQKQDYALAITDYTGDIVPGRKCPFCGEIIPE